MQLSVLIIALLYVGMAHQKGYLALVAEYSLGLLTLGTYTRFPQFCAQARFSAPF